MSDVKRYKVGSTTMVTADDYAKLEAEAQALREQVAVYEDGMRSLACQVGAGGFNAEKLTAAQLVEKVQWGINNLVETQGSLLDEVRTERDSLRARVVIPDRKPVGASGGYAARGWNACLDELARLNGNAVSEELLHRIADTLDDVCHGSALEKELRALLGEGKEHE